MVCGERGWRKISVSGNKSDVGSNGFDMDEFWNVRE